MAHSDNIVDDIFLASGHLRPDVATDDARQVLHEAVVLARDTHWDSIRSPHVFMGLLARPNDAVRNWGERLCTDLTYMLGQFRELFHQEDGEAEPVLVLHREFLSDNAIRLIREAVQRAHLHQRRQLNHMDLLICLLTASNSIVAECFERVGVTAAKLTELAVMAEKNREQS